MTTIDHRILIPAPPDVVWNYVSDITHNPDWQVDCHDVIFLTSRREGPGVRWRYASPDGRECVVAVTAWYNGLGYEYYYVDGMPFRENKGRIRLQEIPEGTIVQWTFTYDLGGIFGGMRNALGMSRQIDHTIADSLKTLWQKIKQSGGTARTYEPKSLMRDAPDVEARSAYQPRHPTPVGSGTHIEPAEAHSATPAPFAVEPPIGEDDGQQISIIDEPPISEEDTRPRRAVTAPAATEPEPILSDAEGEPDFLERISDFSRFEPPREPTDTQPKKPVTPAEPVKPESPAPSALGEETEPLAFMPPERLPVDFEVTSEPEEPTVSTAEAAEATQPDFTLEEMSRVAPSEAKTMEKAPPEPIAEQPSATDSVTEPVVEPKQNAVESAFREPIQAEPEPTHSESLVEPEQNAVESALREPTPAIPEPLVTKSDTASIWEVFGVPRPSTTQEAEAVTSAPASSISVVAAPAAEVSAAPERIRRRAEVMTVRLGLRMILRQQMVNVRRPKA